MRKKNNKTKKINRKRVALFVVLCLLLSIFLLQNRGGISYFEQITRDLFLTPLQILSKTYVKEDEVLTESDVLKSLRLENEELKKEREELKKMLTLTNMLSEYVVVQANVISRNIGYFFDTITINKGSSSGITEGMAVVASGGLIGKTVHVSTYYSDVQLLTGDQMGKISVKIKNGDAFVYGLLTNYDQEQNVYYVEGISQTTDVSVGTEVTTTGMGEIFPSGIFVGTVSNITTDHFDLAKIVEVTPAVNVNDFTIVSVLKRNVNAS